MANALCIEEHHLDVACAKTYSHYNLRVYFIFLEFCIYVFYSLNELHCKNDKKWFKVMLQIVWRMRDTQLKRNEAVFLILIVIHQVLSLIQGRFSLHNPFSLRYLHRMEIITDNSWVQSRTGGLWDCVLALTTPSDHRYALTQQCAGVSITEQKKVWVTHSSTMFSLESQTESDIIAFKYLQNDGILALGVNC